MDVVTRSPGSPPPSEPSTEPLRTGLWISVVLVALTVALLILLIQGPTPARGKRLATMGSKAPIALDLYCVQDATARYLMPYEGSCSSPLEVEFRNRQKEPLYLAIVQVKAGPDGKADVVILGHNLELPTTNGAILSLLPQPGNGPMFPEGSVFAFLGSQPLAQKDVISYAQATFEGQPPTEVRVRAWNISPANIRSP